MIAQAGSASLNTGALLFIAVTWSAVVAATIYCYWRTFRKD